MADDVQKVIDFVAPAHRVLLLTHARPDGDALGSGLALQLSLGLLGKQVTFALLTPWPTRYDFLITPHSPVHAWERPVDLAEFDCIVVVDTCAYGQLEGLGDQLDQNRRRIAVIDHHASRDPIGIVQWIDTEAPACGAMVARLIRQAGWPMDRGVAEALFIALATDTGWFRFSNTTPAGLRLAADLLDVGLDANTLYQHVYQTDTPQRMALLAEVLQGMQLHMGGRVAVVKITQEMYARTGSDPADTEGMIDYPQAIGSVIVTVLAAERVGGGWRVSFRSKTSDADVNLIARQFGGGGHIRAAGAKIENETFESLLPKLLSAIEAEMNRSTQPTA